MMSLRGRDGALRRLSSRDDTHCEGCKKTWFFRVVHTAIGENPRVPRRFSERDPAFVGSQMRTCCGLGQLTLHFGCGHAALVWCLRNNYTFAAMDFGRRLGASDEHIPQWICEERATTPPPKRHAALRVALKLAWGFVAQSVEYRRGYTPSLAPRPRPI